MDSLTAYEQQVVENIIHLHGNSICPQHAINPKQLPSHTTCQLCKSPLWRVSHTTLYERWLGMYHLDRVVVRGYAIPNTMDMVRIIERVGKQVDMDMVETLCIICSNTILPFTTCMKVFRTHKGSELYLHMRIRAMERRYRTDKVNQLWEMEDTEYGNIVQWLPKEMVEEVMALVSV